VHSDAEHVAALQDACEELLIATAPCTVVVGVAFSSSPPVG
jgi:hypothetical protein